MCLFLKKFSWHLILEVNISSRLWKFAALCNKEPKNRTKNKTKTNPKKRPYDSSCGRYDSSLVHAQSRGTQEGGATLSTVQSVYQL